LPALSHLLETVEDGVSDFRVQYPYEEPVVEEILGRLERELPRDRYI
jgi:hypothetical protein